MCVNVCICVLFAQKHPTLRNLSSERLADVLQQIYRDIRGAFRQVLWKRELQVRGGSSVCSWFVHEECVEYVVDVYALGVGRGRARSSTKGYTTPHNVLVSTCDGGPSEEMAPSNDGITAEPQHCAVRLGPVRY